MRIKKTAQTTTTQAQISDGYSTSKIDAYSANYVNNAIKDIYSTTETKTNKVWIDGKPVYRAIFTGRKIGNSDLNLGTISNTDTFVSITGILIDANNNKKTIPFYYSDSIFITVEVQSSGTISIHGASSAFSSGTVTMIIEYTKTTD